MTRQSTLAVAGSFATCCFVSLTAAAQDAPPAAAFDTTTTAAEPSSMPLAAEPRADVVEHSWPNRPLLITGGVLLGGTYAASVIVGAASDRDADKKLYYPVVGP